MAAFHLLLGHAAMAVEVTLGWTALTAAFVPAVNVSNTPKQALPPRGARAALEVVEQNSLRTTSRLPRQGC